MKVYIDQSGKIEDTSKLTIVAYANNTKKVLRISAREKRTLIGIFKKIEYPNKVYIYEIFAGLIFLLTKNSKIQEIYIDKEYPGHEPLIKDIIIKLFQKNSIKVPDIHFTLIGKNNQAHILAISAFRGNTKPDLIVKAKDLISLFYAKKTGRSSHSR